MYVLYSSVATPFAKFSQLSGILQLSDVNQGKKENGDFLCCRVGWLRDKRAATVFVSYSGHFSVSGDGGKNALTNFRGERFIVQLAAK
jgi:hypothetical protein